VGIGSRVDVEGDWWWVWAMWLTLTLNGVPRRSAKEHRGGCICKDKLSGTRSCKRESGAGSICKNEPLKLVLAKVRAFTRTSSWALVLANTRVGEVVFARTSP